MALKLDERFMSFLPCRFLRRQSARSGALRHESGGILEWIPADCDHRRVGKGGPGVSIGARP
jgi:hypothetical protein